MPIEESESSSTPSGRHADHSPWTGISIGVLIVGAVCLSSTSQATARETTSLVLPLAAMGEESWQPLTFRSIEKTTQYELSTDPSGHPAYRAISQCSASAMLLRLPEDFDLVRTPRLAWRWRIENGLENHNERTREGDDFAARVYVLFRFDADRASFWRRLQDQMGRRIFGVEIPGEALSYVWASRATPGDHWTSPDQEDARLLVLESASDKETSRPWREAIVDLAADAGRVFDPPPRLQPYAIGLMTDADDSCESATAWFSEFRLMGPKTALPAAGEVAFP